MNIKVFKMLNGKYFNNFLTLIFKYQCFIVLGMVSKSKSKNEENSKEGTSRWK
jgi:hypothetical protein